MTDTQALAVIKQTKTLPTQIALVRLFAVTQLFYRHPVGEAAADEMNRRTDPDCVSEIFFLTGFCMGAGDAFPKAESWERLVPISP